jgi:hypothetical protein
MGKSANIPAMTKPIEQAETESFGLLSTLDSFLDLQDSK